MTGVQTCALPISFPDSPFNERVEFLPGPLESPSIKVNQLKMSDAGRYTCEFATYPSGNEQGTTTLIMLCECAKSVSQSGQVCGSNSALRETQRINLIKCSTCTVTKHIRVPLLSLYPSISILFSLLPLPLHLYPPSLDRKSVV